MYWGGASVLPGRKAPEVDGGDGYNGVKELMPRNSTLEKWFMRENFKLCW